MSRKDFEMPKCIICGKNYKGYGNNARPVKDGQCCDKCNIEKVIPIRISISMGLRKPKKTEMKGW